MVITLRSEFLDDLSAVGGIDAGGIAPFLLGPLTRDMLRLAIEEPARIAGLRLEPELVARLVEKGRGGINGTCVEEAADADRAAPR